MGDEQQAAGRDRSSLLEPVDRLDVEVVGRLVEDQQVGWAAAAPVARRPAASGRPTACPAAGPGRCRAGRASPRPRAGARRDRQRRPPRGGVRGGPGGWGSRRPGRRSSADDLAAIGRTSPATMRSRVDLPEPLGPTMATRSRRRHPEREVREQDAALVAVREARSREEMHPAQGTVHLRVPNGARVTGATVSFLVLGGRAAVVIDVPAEGHFGALTPEDDPVVWSFTSRGLRLLPGFIGQQVPETDLLLVCVRTRAGRADDAGRGRRARSGSRRAARRLARRRRRPRRRAGVRRAGRGRQRAHRRADRRQVTGRRGAPGAAAGAVVGLDEGP